ERFRPATCEESGGMRTERRLEDAKETRRLSARLRHLAGHRAVWLLATLLAAIRSSLRATSGTPPPAPQPAPSTQHPALRQAAFQRFFPIRQEPPTSNIPYDGRFIFARVRYTTGPGGYYYRGLPAWAHGYSEAERNLMKILHELSDLAPHLD